MHAEGETLNLKTFGAAIFIAAAYDAWPNLAKALKINGGLVAVVATAVTLGVISIISHRDIARLGSVSVSAIAWMLAVGLANGAAVYLYGQQAADQNVSTGMFLATVFAIQVILAPLADWLVTRSVPIWQQFIGIGLIASGIMLIVAHGKR